MSTKATRIIFFASSSLHRSFLINAASIPRVKLFYCTRKSFLFT